MASFTLSALHSVFPSGTSVKAYPVSNWTNGNVNTAAAPVGSETATATMGANGLSFTGLAANTEYVAYALVSSQHRYVRFATRDTSGTGVVSGSDLEAAIAAHAGSTLLHPPAYGYATYTNAGVDITGKGAAYPSYGDLGNGLQVTITADGTSPIIVEFIVPGATRTSGTGTIAMGVREGTNTPICNSATSVAAANSPYQLYARSAPFVPTAGSHTYKACATYIGGSADVAIQVPSAEFAPVLAVTGVRTS